MWKKLKSRGAETVEYAIVLACIAAFGLMFSDNLTHTLETLMGKTGSIITNGSTNNGNQENDEDNNNQENEQDKLNQKIEDNNLKWIGNLFDCSKEQNPDKGFGNYLVNSIKTRKDLNFTNDEGLIDSGSGSPFVKNIEGTLYTNEIISGCSWAFAGYTENGQKYYNVSIYNPAKNGGKSLADVKPGKEIKTDIYRVKVTPDGSEIVKITDYPKQQIAAVRKDKNYIVIRDSSYNQ